jgi:hypothetical protein
MIEYLAREARRARESWSWKRRAAGSLAAALRRDPVGTLRQLRTVRFNKKSLHSLSLRLDGKEHLRDFYAVSEALGARPVLFWGTLLGHVRENGFLAHDHDIDVALLPEDAPKKDALIAAMARVGYLKWGDGPSKVTLFKANRPVTLDIDILVPRGDWLVAISERPEGVVINRFSPEAIGRPQPAVFLGDLNVYVPEHPEAILESIYGDWRIPKPDYNSMHDPIGQILEPRPRPPRQRTGSR